MFRGSVSNGSLPLMVEGTSHKKGALCQRASLGWEQLCGMTSKLPTTGERVGPQMATVRYNTEETQDVVGAMLAGCRYPPL